MERFFSAKNIECYRTLASPTDEVERRAILEFLAQEEAKLKAEIVQAKTRRLERAST
jgi:hypothetical protein